MENRNEIILYQADELRTRIEVRIESENIWLTQQQIVDLFDSSKANISEHIKHIFKTGELNKTATVRNFRTVRLEGSRKVMRELQHYSLDVIISVGYRVNSIRGTQFRIWANQVLKSYLLKGYAVNKRMDRLEEDIFNVAKRLNTIELHIKSDELPKQGILFNGQMYDAYSFTAGLIRSAKKSIILIDNYIDDTVLTLLSKREKNVSASIFSKAISKQLRLDLQKHNSQYPKINIHQFTDAQDRFLILDENHVYHFGASLKDLGKKWFAFSKMEGMTEMVLGNLKKL
jgi:hypothetical protein